VPEHCAAHEKFDLNCVDCKAARRENPLRLHDLHQVWCPKCRAHILYTDSPSMVAEAKAEGVPDTISLIEPLEATFQGERTKIFPLKCTCGESYLSFVDVVNRERIEQVTRDLLPYYPNIGSDADLRKRYLEPKRRDIIITREEFAQRVLAERNQMVRAALMRRCDERRLGIQWRQPQLVARLVLPDSAKPA
jgi:hypothetical protein